jgi:hypothetical protein
MLHRAAFHGALGMAAALLRMELPGVTVDAPSSAAGGGAPEAAAAVAAAAAWLGSPRGDCIL